MVQKKECNVINVTSTENLVKVVPITNNINVHIIIIAIIITVIIFVITFMQAFTITYLKQTIFLRYTGLQLFCMYSLCHM